MIEESFRKIVREEIQFALNSFELKIPVQEQKSRWLTTKQAAEYLGISVPTIYNWVKIGKLKRHYNQNSPRYDRNEIDKILKN